MDPDFTIIDDMILSPVQYDVLFQNPSNRIESLQAVRIWPGAVVPFMLDNNFSELQRILIKKLQSILTHKTFSLLSSYRWEKSHQSCSEHHTKAELREVWKNLQHRQVQRLRLHQVGAWMRFDCWFLGRKASSLSPKSGKSEQVKDSSHSAH